MIMQIPSSTIKSAGITRTDYDPKTSKLKPADPEVLAKLLENEPKTGKRDVFIRSDVPENERVTSIYEGISYDETLAVDKSAEADNNSVRVVSGMSNRELYEMLTGEKCPISSSGDIDFNDWYTSIVIASKAMIKQAEGIGTLIPNLDNIGQFRDNIANYYGNMAKRLDAAYAEGKLTKEEYDRINDSVMERMEHATTCAERNAAWHMVARERSMSIKEYERRQTMTPEEYRADMEAATDKYVRMYTKIDRVALMKLFNNIRFGK